MSASKASHSSTKSKAKDQEKDGRSIKPINNSIKPINSLKPINSASDPMILSDIDRIAYQQIMAHHPLPLPMDVPNKTRDLYQTVHQLDALILEKDRVAWEKDIVELYKAYVYVAPENRIKSRWYVLIVVAKIFTKDHKNFQQSLEIWTASI
jgi:hypothetical protein